MGDILADLKEHRVASRLTHFTWPSPGPRLASGSLDSRPGGGRQAPAGLGMGNSERPLPRLGLFLLQALFPTSIAGCKTAPTIPASFLFLRFFFSCGPLKKNFFLIYLWLCWVFVAAWLFSSFGEPRLLSNCSAQASHGGSFSYCRALTLACAC